jgi:hypothetical protein
LKKDRCVTSSKTQEHQTTHCYYYNDNNDIS